MASPKYVRGHLVADASDWPHASTRAHLLGRDDGLVDVVPLLGRVPNFVDLLDVSGEEAGMATCFDAPAHNGRPLGDADFLARLEAKLGRGVRPSKRGPKAGNESPSEKIGI